MVNAPTGYFLPGRSGPLFILRHGPDSSSRCVLVVPPFAEEMNKSRRMVALVAAKLAAAGIAVVVPDLYGTGDSGGDFVDAEWSLWRDDLQRTARWCEETVGPVTGLLAIRLGSAMARDDVLLAALSPLSHTVLWQPVLDGARYMTQFLRLRVAASMANNIKETVTDLRRELAATGEIEVAGYRLSANLVASIDAVKQPSTLPATLGRVEWLELVREIGLPISSFSAALIEASVRAGSQVVGSAITGEPFWASTEIVTNDELICRTTSAFLGDSLTRVP